MAGPRETVSEYPIAIAVRQSTVYRVVMTPVNMVSFIISLALVDMRYAALRKTSHQHGSPLEDGHRCKASWVPSWLHRTVFRRAVTQTPGPGPSRERRIGRNSDQDGTETYYHSKQRKLMRMEAEDAFQVRGWVLLVLGFLSLVVLFGTALIGRMVLSEGFRRISERVW